MVEYDDIRPYRDDEVAGVLDALLHDKEALDSVARLRLGRVQKWMPFVARKMVQLVLTKELKGIDSIASFQNLVAKYMARMIASATSGFTVSGISNLQHGESYLFLSNHRDITLDPSFTNLALVQNGFKTSRVAIGDNLLEKKFAGDLLRCNKAFIVNRSAVGRQMLMAYKKLSNYIQFSLHEEHEPIWLAQREGRAKDGNDKTEPAIIKMLAMSKARGESLSAFIEQCRIVPVSISYEWDPCDASKARELAFRAQNDGDYTKGPNEDVISMGLGISGFKGGVNVHFGKPLQGDFSTPVAVAEAVDAQIWDNYRLFNSNLVAYEMLYNEVPELPVGADEQPFNREAAITDVGRMNARLAALPEEQRDYLLGIYANPVVARLRSTQQLEQQLA